MGVKSLRWFLFTVLVALLPFAFVYYFGNYDSLWKFIGDKKADIVFMGVTFCAVGIGELLESATSNVTMPKTLTHLLLGASIVVVIVATLLYAGISLGKTASNLEFICLSTFGVSVVLSTGCIALSEFIERKIVEQKIKTQDSKTKQDCGDKVIELIISSGISEDHRRKLAIEICEKLNLSLPATQFARLSGQ